MYHFDEKINRKNTAAAKWDEVARMSHKKDLIPLTTADMEFRTPPAVIEAMKKRLDHGIFGYTKPDDRFFQAISSFVEKHHGFTVTPEMLVCSTSVVPAIVAGIKACSKKEEGVILFSPAYTAFYSSIRNTNRCLKDCPLIYHDGFYSIDFALLEELAKDKKNRILLLCNPHNPVGRVWSREELLQIVAICSRYDLYLISDEIHWDIILEGKHVSLGELSNLYRERIIVCTAPSKTFNLAGTQLAYTIIFDDGLKKAFKEELLKSGQGEALSIFGYEALIAAYESGEQWLSELLEYIKGNIILFEQWLIENEPKIRMIKPEGTYLAWLDCRMVEPDFATWYRHLMEQGIYLTNGSYFGEQGEGFVRVNLALPKDELMKILMHWKESKLLT